jgi:hypothetical protein
MKCQFCNKDVGMSETDQQFYHTEDLTYARFPGYLTTVINRPGATSSDMPHDATVNQLGDLNQLLNQLKGILPISKSHK